MIQNLTRTLATLSIVLMAIGVQQAPAQESLSPAVRSLVDVNAPVVALTGALLIDGTGRGAAADQTVVIRDGMIAAVGPSGSVDIPSGAEVIDLGGKTLVPGFVMLHEHLFYPAGRGAYNQQQFSFPRLYLAGGTTTIRTGGSRDPYGDLNLKAAIDGGRVPGPNMYLTAPYVNGPGLPILFVNALSGPDDARRMARYWADEGFTSYKTYMQISRAELGAVIEEAHARGLKVTGHLCSVTFREAADLGIDNLEHGLSASTDFVANKEPDRCPSGGERTRSLLDVDMDGEPMRSLIAHLVERGIAITSTLTVFEISTPGRPSAPSGALDAMSPQARDQYLRTWAQVQRRGEQSVTLFEKMMQFEHAFVRAGGQLVAGTDPTGYGGVVAGYANQREVELLVEAGLSVEEAVQVATQNGARHLGIEDRVGTIEVGKAADLIVLTGDLTEDVSVVRRMELVFKGGVGFSSARLFDSVQGTVGVH